VHSWLTFILTPSPVSRLRFPVSGLRFCALLFALRALPSPVSVFPSPFSGLRSPVSVFIRAFVANFFFNPDTIGGESVAIFFFLPKELRDLREPRDLRFNRRWICGLFFQCKSLVKITFVHIVKLIFLRRNIKNPPLPPTSSTEMSGSQQARNMRKSFAVASSQRKKQPGKTGNSMISEEGFIRHAIL
jgi:hypothetical protein